MHYFKVKYQKAGFIQAYNMHPQTHDMHPQMFHGHK